MLLDGREEVLRRIALREDDGLAAEGADLRAADVEDVGEAGDGRKVEVGRRAGESVAEPRAVQEERQVIFCANFFYVSQFLLRVKRPVLGRPGEVDHAGTDHVVPRLVAVEPLQEGAEFPGIHLPRVRGDGQDLVAAELDGAGFMDRDVSRFRSDNALVAAQHRVDDRGVGLGPADKEEYVRRGAAGRGADSFPGLAAEAVVAVAGLLFEVRFHERLQDGRMGAFVVITGK